MSKATIITIRTKPVLNLRRVAISWALIVACIGLGVITGSTAMQWAGFLVAALSIVGLALREAAKDTDLTIAQARKRLDEIEAEQAK